MNDPIDSLLDQANAYAQKRLGDGHDPADPSFVDFKYKFPREELTSYNKIRNGEHSCIEMRENKLGQRGMYAKCDVEAGAWLAMSQPIAVYWDVENEAAPETKPTTAAEDVNDENSDEDHDNQPTSLRDTTREAKLILRTIEKIISTPSTWEDTLTHLYPRDTKTALALPPWICTDEETRLEVERQMKRLPTLSLFPSAENETICKDISLRLPLIVRYNAFLVETSSELFVYADLEENGLKCLSGVGLYGPELSYFNHSCTPNASKFSVGDVTFLFANRNIAKGSEICHSYISHEYLCESEQTRTAILANDFSLEMNIEDTIAHEKERPAKRRKGDSSTMQTSDVICVPPFILSECFDQDNGQLYKPKGPGQDFKIYPEYLFPIWKARMLEDRGRSNSHRGDKKLGLEHALPQWEAAIEFAEATFPPLDVRKICLYVQASICASVNAFHDWAKVALQTKGLRVGDKNKAKKYAKKAIEMHHAIFGGGRLRFLKRYVDEFLTSDSNRGQMSQAQLLYSLEDLWDFGEDSWEELTQSKERGNELIKNDGSAVEGSLRNA